LENAAADLDALVTSVVAGPHPDATFRALLVLLSAVPDSSLIVSALGKIEPALITDAALRSRAADLLFKAEAPQDALAWAPVSAEAPKLSNVVSLKTAEPVTRDTGRADVTFADIGGLEHVKTQIRRKIIAPFTQKAGLFERFKRKAGGGVLMYGPPGCGKTMLARALASECRATFFNVRPGDILDQYVGNSEKKILQLFDQARSRRPAVMFFDEIEALAQRRQFESSTRVNTTVSALLTEMDGFGDQQGGILFLGATNVPWSLDVAFRRPGRFDRTLFVPPPDRIARGFILGQLLEKRPVDPTLDRDRIVEKSTGFSGADMAALVDTAIDFAIEESPSEDALKPLSNAHFNEAFSEVKSSVGEWLGQARKFAQYDNESGMYDDLADFLKKYTR
jgi:SpoVK/Ycf46/Vps4 family AAA+-type ATPase